MTPLLLLVLVPFGDVEPTAPGRSETVATVRAFVAEHHSELDSLLTDLEDKPAAYHAAIDDLDRQRRRLVRIQQKMSPVRYERELSLWKLDSRIRLAAARASAKTEMGGDSRTAERELRQLLAEKAELRRLTIEEDLARAREQIERLETERQRYVGADPPFVQTETERLMKAAAAARRASARRDAAKAKKAPSRRRPPSSSGDAGSSTTPRQRTAADAASPDNAASPNNRPEPARETSE